MSLILQNMNLLVLYPHVSLGSIDCIHLPLLALDSIVLIS